MIEKIIIGTVQFGLNYGITNKNGKINPTDIENIFCFTNNNSITLFDTANGYGDSEDILLFYKKKYNNICIITKSSFSNDNDSRQIIKQSINKFDYIHYYLLHSFTDYNQEIIKLLCEFKKNNLIGKIGVSIYTVDEAIILLDDENIDVIQIPFNYLDKQWHNNIFLEKLNKRKNVEIHVRSIFLQGILLNSDLVKVPSNIKYEDFIYLFKTIDEICNELKLSKMELCFSYINSFSWINKFLIGIDNYQHLLDNFNVIQKNKLLSDEEINYIKNKVDKINPLVYKPNKWLFN